jgi:hypothetical protein
LFSLYLSLYPSLSIPLSLSLYPSIPLSLSLSPSLSPSSSTYTILAQKGDNRQVHQRHPTQNKAKQTQQSNYCWFSLPLSPSLHLSPSLSPSSHLYYLSSRSQYQREIIAINTNITQHRPRQSKLSSPTIAGFIQSDSSACIRHVPVPIYVIRSHCLCVNV